MSAETDPNAATRIYLDRLERTNPPPKVQAVIDEIRAELTEPEVNGLTATEVAYLTDPHALDKFLDDPRNLPEED